MEARLTNLERLALDFDTDETIEAMAVQPETFEQMIEEYHLGDYRDWEFVQKPNQLPYFEYRNSRKVTQLA